MEEKVVSLGGGIEVPVHYHSGPSPDAPALVLVHGLGVTAYLNWSRCFDALGETFRLVAFDLRGHGRGLRTYHFTLEDCADDVVKVADAVGFDRFFVAGYSMGGPIAKLCWRRHPHRVAGIVLAATASEFGFNLGSRRARTLMTMVRSAVLLNPRWVKKRVSAWAVMRLGHVLPPLQITSELSGHRLGTVLGAAKSLAGYSANDWLDKIDVPTAIVVTSDDDRVSPASQRALASIPGAVIFETPGTHTACITNPETFVPAMLEACLDVWRRSAQQAISA